MPDGIEGVLDPAAQLTADRPLLAGPRLDDQADVDAVGAQRLHAPDLRLVEEDGLVVGFVGHLGATRRIRSEATSTSTP